MRPNLAFGPIDSIAQYLLYLSVVVLGVLLPLLLNKWRMRREQRQLLERTLVALRDEVSGNRRRTASSHDSFIAALGAVEAVHARYLERRAQAVAGRPDLLPEAQQPDLGVNLALTTRVAWDVAGHAQALTLMPAEQLRQFTRAYQMQALYERDRDLLLELVMQLEVLDLPADLTRLDVLDARLALLTRARTVLRYQAGLAKGVLDCFDEALGADAPKPGPAPTMAAA